MKGNKDTLIERKIRIKNEGKEGKMEKGQNGRKVERKQKKNQ